MTKSDEIKRGFAIALRELVKVKRYDAITISDISKEAGKTRKAFYYHFYNKTQLLNWIFRNDFVVPNIDTLAKGGLPAFYEVAKFFLDNKDFYENTPLMLVQKGYDNYVLNVMEIVANVTMEPVYSVYFPEDESVLHVSNHMLAEAFRLALIAYIDQDEPSAESVIDFLRRFYEVEDIALELFLSTEDGENAAHVIKAARINEHTFPKTDTNITKRILLDLPY